MEDATIEPGDFCEALQSFSFMGSQITAGNLYVCSGHDTRRERPSYLPLWMPMRCAYCAAEPEAETHLFLKGVGESWCPKLLRKVHRPSERLAEELRAFVGAEKEKETA